VSVGDGHRIDAMSDGGGARAGIRDRQRRLAGIVLSLAIVVTVVVLAVQGDGGDGTPELDTTPHLVDEGDLLGLAASLGHPVYWAGPEGAERMEMTQQVDGSLFLRYLTPGVEPGDPRGIFLTVGTYPVVDAQGALRRTARKSGSQLGHVADGGLVLVNPAENTSVYLAYPGSDLQLEVYDPTPGRSMSLIRSGAIQPLG
jgi:hypothetical protein